MSVFPAEIPLIAAGSELAGYRLIREIGRGGMAVVFEAEELALRRRVAIKVFHPRFEASCEGPERFLREAEAAGRLTHPAAVRVFGRGVSRGIPYIVTELVRDARDLESLWLQWCEQPSTLPADHVRLVASWMAEVAEALAEAHAAGVLHRDLKPANLLVDGEGRVRLVDFGLASIRDQVGLSRTGEMSGTPYYMCPEQVRTGSFSRDGSCDVYSLGATMYQLLTLTRPFAGETPEQVFHSILHLDPEHPRRLRPQLPRDLVRVCLKAMEKDPRRRYANMTEFAHDLHRFLRHEPVLAQPPSVARRVRTWMHRHPRISVATMLGGISLIGFSLAGAELAGAQNAKREAVERLRLEQGQRHGILMRAASRAVRGFRFADARELLALTETDKRNWASRYLEARMQRHLVTLQPPGGPRLLGAAIHPEGRFVAAGFGDGSLLWWQALSGQEAHQVDHFQFGVFGIAFSPDGHRLAAAGDDTVIRIYDTDTLQPVRELTDHEYGIGWVQYSADGRWLASADDGGEVVLWEAESGAEHLRVQVEPRAIMVNFSPDGREFAVADGAHRILRYATADGRMLGEPITVHRASVFDLEYRGNQELWSASLDGSVRQFHLRADAVDPGLHWQEESAVQSLAADGESWLLGRKDGNVLRLSPEGKVLDRFGAHFAFANVVEADPRGRFVLTGGDDGAVQLWHPEAVEHDWSFEVGHKIEAATFLDEGQLLLMRTRQGEVMLWDLTERRPLSPSAVEIGHAKQLPHADAMEQSPSPPVVRADHPTEDLTAKAHRSGTLQVFGESGTEPLLDFPGSHEKIRAVAFVPSLDGLAWVRADGRIQFVGTMLSPLAPR